MMMGKSLKNSVYMATVQYGRNYGDVMYRLYAFLAVIASWTVILLAAYGAVTFYGKYIS